MVRQIQREQTYKQESCFLFWLPVTEQLQHRHLFGEAYPEQLISTAYSLRFTSSVDELEEVLLGSTTAWPKVPIVLPQKS